jgi:putative DNA primase/helicase
MPSCRKPKRDEIKDKGGFVGGHLRDNLRKVGNVACRSMWTPDLDNATPEFVAALEAKLAFKCAVYSTHSHTPEAPRLRIVAPFSRDVSADEFVAISRYMAANIGIDMFDECSFIPNQLMYWPTCPTNGEYLCEFFDGELLDPDAILAGTSKLAGLFFAAYYIERKQGQQAKSAKTGGPACKNWCGWSFLPRLQYHRRNRYVPH